MTFEEKMEFLRQSIESHDRQLGEITDQQAETGRQIGALQEEIGALKDQQAETGRQIGALKDQQAETGRQIGALKDQQAETNRQIGTLNEHQAGTDRQLKHALDIMVATVGRLALIVEKHENRLQGLEGV